MNYNKKYEKAIRRQPDLGHKAQFSLLVKANKLELPIDIQCNLFEKLVFPIMLYGCEIWGTQPQDILETFYRKFIFKIQDHPHPAAWYMVKLVNYHST